MPRATTFWSGAIESSRSSIKASAAVFFALSNLRTLSPGTNRNDRIDSSLWLRFAMHQACTAAACDHLPALVGCSVLELDDALHWSRFAGSFGDDLRMRFQRVAMKHGLRKLDVGHTEIADRRPKRCVVYAHAYHDPESVKAVEQPLTEFGVFREMSVKVQWLRVHRQQAEHGVVHFGDGPAEFMMKFPTYFKLFKV